MVVAPPGKRRLYFHRQFFPILVTVSSGGIIVRILVGISVVDVSVVRVPPIRKTEGNEIKIAEEMAMMASVTISEIPMAPKVVISEAAIVMTPNRYSIAAARRQRHILRSESASESGCSGKMSDRC